MHLRASLALALTAAASRLLAQTPAPAPAPSLNFSGVIYSNYQYRTDAATKNFHKFDRARTYLTFRMPAGDKASIRVTTDVFQQQNAANAAYYGGWVVRIKYAYLQYDYFKNADWAANARLGVVHTVVVDHEEQFFPRWIAQVALERAGYFSSADAGIATTVTLPNKMGEVYGTIVNGVGYGNRETDRFKDFAARVSLTPFANSPTTLLKTITISPWALTGGAPDKIAGLTSGLRKDRYGIFAGIRDPRLTAGADVAQNPETIESGTTPATRVVSDSTGRVLSAFVWAKPWATNNTSGLKPLGALVRFDKITPRTDGTPSATGLADYHFFIGGLTWDLNNRVGLSFDYQEQLPNSIGTVTQSKTWFAHLVANF
jgi:hypothetical protein